MMTPKNFAERVRALLAATTDEPAVRHSLAFDLMLEALHDNGFGQGTTLLVNAMPEKIPPALAAQGVANAR